MAKDEIKNEVKAVEKYYLTDKILSEGYYGKFDNIEILVDFERDYQGKRISRYASTGTFINSGKEFISDHRDYLELSDPKIIYSLANAKVIKLRGDVQKKIYMEYLKTLKPVRDYD